MSETRVVKAQLVPATPSGWKALLEEARGVRCAHFALRTVDYLTLRSAVPQPSPQDPSSSLAALMGVPVITDDDVLPDMVELRTIPEEP